MESLLLLLLMSVNLNWNDHKGNYVELLWLEEEFTELYFKTS